MSTNKLTPTPQALAELQAKVEQFEAEIQLLKNQAKLHGLKTLLQVRQERGRIENLAETREEELTSSFNQQYRETKQSLQTEIDQVSARAEAYEKVVLSKTAPEKTSELLSVTVQRFINEHSGKSWDENTTNETTAILNVMLEIIGDIPVHLLSSTIAREFKDKLQKIPRNKYISRCFFI